LSAISLKFENAVNGKGKAKTDKASPPCLISSRLDIFFRFSHLFFRCVSFLKVAYNESVFAMAGYSVFRYAGTDVD
jgi:hypothetical protein